MKKSIVAVGALALFLNAAPALAQNSVTVPLNTENSSGETGTATLTAMGNQTQVVLTMTGGPATLQPDHIHAGQCGATLNPVPKYPLTPLVNGKSTTMVPTTLSSLMTGHFAINVHKSPQQGNIYVACGNIPVGTTTASTTTATTATTSTSGAAATYPAAPATGGGYGATQTGGAALPLAALVAVGLAAYGIVARRLAR